MPREYGPTNAAPWASAPAVGPAGDTYWNTATKVLYVSDGTSWIAAGPGAGGPPSGAAGGDLQGTYPNPTIKPTSLPWTDDGTAVKPTTAARSVMVGAATAKWRLGDSSGASATGDYQLRYNCVSAGGVTDEVTHPAWAARMGNADDFALFRSVAGASASFVQQFQVKGSDGKTYCTLADQSVNINMIAAGNTLRGIVSVAVPTNYSNLNTNVWVELMRSPSMTTRAPWVLVTCNISGFVTVNPTGGTVYFGIWRDNYATALTWAAYPVKSPATANTQMIPPTFAYWDNCGAGSHNWSMSLYQGTNTLFGTFNDSAAQGKLQVMEFA